MALNTARVLRDADAKRSRNRLLKASCSEGDVAELMASSSESDYIQRRRILARVRKKSVSNTKLVTAKMMYVKEQSHMVTWGLDMSREVSTMLEQMLNIDIELGSGSALASAVHAMMSMEQEREVYSKGLSSQIREAKEMIANVSKRKLKHLNELKKNGLSKKSSGPGSGGGDDAGKCVDGDKENAKSAAATGDGRVAPSDTEACRAEGMQMDSAMAQLLVSMRTSHNEEGARLAAEEVSLTTEVNKARREIGAMLRDDTRKEEDKKLLEDMTMRDDDDVETHLFMEAWMARVREVDERHSAAMHAFSERAASFKLSAEEGLGDAWKSDTDQQLFSKIYVHSEMQGYPRARLMQALKTQMPHMSDASLDAYETFFLHQRSSLRKKKELLQSYRHEREELLSQARGALVAVRQERIAVRMRDAEIAARRALAEQLHARLDDYRVQERERLSAAEALRAREEEAASAAQARLDATRRADFDRKKVLVDAFREARRAADAAAAERAREAARVEAEKRHAEIEDARPNVERRQQLLDERAKEMARKEALLAEEAERIAVFLQRLADTVRPEVDSRLDNSTAAVEAHQYLGAPEQHRGHIALAGFTDEKMFSDARFRLGHYLHAAGVSHSVVSRAVVREWAPRPQAPLPTIW